MANRTKIAIIEDDQAIAQMYRMKFESEGFDVELAADGNSALDMIKDYEPAAVIMDVNLPGMNGAEILESMRTKDYGKDLPVIFLTNAPESEIPNVEHDKKVLGYIVKAESTPRQVVAKVKELTGLTAEQ